MAIRFQCPACSEPIEVDDAWARQVVRCPYCQRTVTAPAESTLPAQEQIPEATPIAARAEFQPKGDPVTPGGAVPPFPPTTQTNTAAMVAFVLALITAGLWLFSMQLTGRHLTDIQEMQRFVNEEMAKGTPMMSAQLKYLEKYGGRWPGWMWTISGVWCGSLLTWIGAWIFGIIGVLRPVRRGFAVTALIITGSLTGFCCLSALGGMTGGS